MVELICPHVPASDDPERSCRFDPSVQFEVIGISFQHFKRSFIGWLKWLTDCIDAYEDVSAS